MTDGWETKTIGDVCQIRGGGTPSKAVDRYWQGDIPWVSPKDMKSDVVSDSMDHISRDAIEDSAASLIPTDSVLIVVRSGILARTVPIAITGRDVTVNQDLKALCPNGAIDSRFLYHLLDSKMGILLSLVSRGATVHRLMTEQVRSLQISLPPLPEQRRIVGILDEAFEGIDTAKVNAEKNLHNARAIFESHLQSVFARRGGGWVEKNLGDVCEFRRGLTYSKGDEVDYSHNVVLRATNIDRASHRLDFAELRYINDDVIVPQRMKVEKGSLLICTASGSKSHLGKIAFIDDDYGYAFGGFMGMLTPNSDLVPRYLFHVMTSRAYEDFIGALADGMNINNLKFDDLKQFHVLYPPIHEQQRIAAQLDALIEGTQRLESVCQRKLAAFDEMKKSLLDQAFTGQLTKSAA